MRVPNRRERCIGYRLNIIGVRVWKDRYQLFDVNKDYFEIQGVGYPDADIVPLLRMVNAAFDPETVHEPVAVDYKEFLTGRRFPWAHDRVM